MGVVVRGGDRYRLRTELTCATSGAPLRGPEDGNSAHRRHRRLRYCRPSGDLASRAAERSFTRWAAGSKLPRLPLLTCRRRQEPAAVPPFAVRQVLACGFPTCGEDGQAGSPAAGVPTAEFTCWKGVQPLPSSLAVSCSVRTATHSVDRTFLFGSWLWRGPWSPSPGAHLACWVERE
jgi:hypothetical protein